MKLKMEWNQTISIPFPTPHPPVLKNKTTTKKKQTNLFTTQGHKGTTHINYICLHMSDDKR